METKDEHPDSLTRKKNDEDKVRLNVFLQEFGVASRRKADWLIQTGAVSVNGSVVNTLGARISRHESIVSVNGKRLKALPPKVVCLFHKPPLTLTTRDDSQEKPTIYNFDGLKKFPQHVQSVGRLDYRSEGLLLMTNDGQLAMALTHPRYGVEKTYAVLVSGQVTETDIKTLRTGVELDDGPARAIAVRPGTKENLGNSVGVWLELVINEGRNRLIRRMMEAIGLKVIRLVRIAIGAVRLPGDLKPGEWRLATESELNYFESIKNRSKTEKTATKKTPGVKPDEEILAIRKIKKTVKLNDEAYAREAQRRALRAEEIYKAKQKKESSSGKVLRPRFKT